MDNWFGNRRWLFIFVSIIILALVMSMTIKERENITWVERAVIDASAFVQKLFYKPANAVVGLFDDIRKMRQLYSENKRMTEALSHMEYIQAELRIVNEENKRIRELLDFKETIRDFDVIAANVVGRSPVRWDNIITIDRGRKHGIERNMAVINEQGLIGKVYTVSNYSAKVLLMTDSHAPSGISALILGKEESFGVIEEYAPQHGYLLMSMIKPDVTVEKGDLVVTSGYGEVFPKGLVIGTVQAGRKSEGGLTQSIYVEPAALTNNLHEVLVIKRSLMIDQDFHDTIEEANEGQPPAGGIGS
ncbi:rod shape-determining protein MreC [Desulfuribacillus stibiiarsenatis]|uniref:Cell shape-determining protein MreC n=1 Tax=Desulfuribacillus stibiiarsenatis TaxID=1390249 RepID=A0A1E5L2A5_9FIRM|nr:rod shape-determining protein MreC [Desulfuribacillus stibiiarsenatis]OEH84234.1 rod shape-determining protein MreC [Desulfuribacillus stibiiarsenatis]